MARRDILGRAISINGEPATIVGVMPAWFRFPSGGELPTGLGYAPLPEVWSLDKLTPEQQRFRGGKSFALVGRLRPDQSRQAAEAELAAIAADIARESPASNAGWTVRVIPLREQLVGGVRTALIVLLTAVGFVLLIACSNVANLLLVRAASRQREVAVRYALGAERWQILRQQLIESLLLSLAAGAIGMLIGWWALQGLLVMLPPGTPAVSDAVLDWRVVAFTAARVDCHRPDVWLCARACRPRGSTWPTACGTARAGRLALVAPIARATSSSSSRSGSRGCCSSWRLS